MANFKDGAIGIVATAPSPATTGTALIMQTGHGARQAATPYFATAYPPGVLPNPSNWEIVQVTARSTDTITIVRAQKGSSAQSIGAGWIIANAIYADDVYNAGVSAPEVLSGTPNGTLTTFGLSQSYSSLLGLYKNGVYMRPGSGNDYTLNAAGNQVTFATAPANGSVLVAIGIIGGQVNVATSNSKSPPEVPAGLVNGTNKAYTLSRGYIPGSTLGFVNGILQQPGVHYQETSPVTGLVTFDDAPLTGDNVLFVYDWSTGIAGNAATVGGKTAAELAQIGDITMSLRASPGINRLFMAGQTLNKADYPLFWAMIGSNPAYITASTTLTFTLADMRTRVPVGKAATGTFAVLAAMMGTETETLTTAQMPSHDHSTAWKNFMPSGTGSLALNDRGGDGILVSDNAAHGSNGEDLGNNRSMINNEGGGTAHNNIQPSIVVNFEVIVG